MEITRYFMHDHQEVDGILRDFEASLEAGWPDPELLEQFEARLRRHMYWEEEILFPAVEGHGLQGPIAVMIAEHGEICRSIAAIQRGLQEGEGQDRLERHLRDLKETLVVHNGKEEGILYPTADEVLGAVARDMVAQVSAAYPPEGWTCRAGRLASAAR